MIKYFEVNEPYYALLKAEDIEEAKLEYNASVAGLEDIESINQVQRDYAIIKYTAYFLKDAETKGYKDMQRTVCKIFEQFKEIEIDSKMCFLLMDGALN